MMASFTRTDKILFLSIILYPLILAIVSILIPAIWDNFVWPYYVAPIVADAGGDAGGITSSYNPVDTMTYAIILSISVYLIYRSFSVWGFRIGGRYVIARCL